MVLEGVDSTFIIIIGQLLQSGDHWFCILVVVVSQVVCKIPVILVKHLTQMSIFL